LLRIDGNVLTTVLAQASKEISPEAATFLLASNVQPNPMPASPTPQDEGQHSALAVNYLAPEALVHSGYPTIGIGFEHKIPEEFTHSRLFAHHRIDSPQAVLTPAESGPVTFFITRNETVGEGAVAGYTVGYTGTLAIGQTATVQVQTSDGAAIAGSDYTAVPLTTLTFVGGDPTTQLLSVQTLPDLVTEPNEMFTIGLLNPSSNARINLEQAQVTDTIVDHDVLVYEGLGFGSRFGIGFGTRHSHRLFARQHRRDISGHATECNRIGLCSDQF